MPLADGQTSMDFIADRDLVRRSRATALAYFVLFSVIVGFSSYSNEHLSTVLSVGAGILLATGWRGLLLWRFDSWYRSSASRWRTGFVIGTLALAGSWGLFCMITLVHYGLDPTAMLVLLSTAGITAGAVTTLSINLTLVNTYIGLMLIPSTIAAALVGTREAYAIAFLFATFFAFMRVVANRLHTEYWRALRNTELLDQHARELEASNQELESYSYSIAHDLRAPLRTMISFSQVLQEDAGDRLNAEEKGSLSRVVNAGKHMAQLIEDILELSRITRKTFHARSVDLSQMASASRQRLFEQEPGRNVEWHIEPDLKARGDPRLLEIALSNLMENAWKFTGTKADAQITFGSVSRNGETVYYVKDNGVGFDMRYSDKLFNPFNRLHRAEEFPGTGIGLATVKRVIQRHGGRVWAEAVPGQGASFYFVLGETRENPPAISD